MQSFWPFLAMYAEFQKDKQIAWNLNFHKNPAKGMKANKENGGSFLFMVHGAVLTTNFYKSSHLLNWFI